jgi:hypothetical protein
LSNICSIIDGTYIPLTDRPNRRVTFAASDFSIGKYSIVLFCKVFVLQTKYFGIYVLDNLKKCMMEGNSKFQAYTKI